MNTILHRIFPMTDRDNLSDWASYIWCRIVGHEPDFHFGWHCTRCHDVLLSNDPRQP